ncbi:MAG: hydantoinase/oxoprolinase family protein [Gammaproteobacteria bacterium]|nr:hydantoinase/oxoprolinase family protein [Gammaproteobacteria bacterium]
MYKLGIDVGGTNIDFAVVDDKNQLRSGHKILAKGELHLAIAEGLAQLQKNHGITLSSIATIHLGTTLAINSLLELKSLYKVGLIRLANHSPDFPPAYLWPKTYRDAIVVGYRNVSGGREYNNHSRKLLNRDELLFRIQELIDNGAQSLALVSVFAPLYSDDEIAAAHIIRNEFDIPVSLSHELGSLGFIERENTTLLNAALKKVLREGFQSLTQTFTNLGFKGDCFITQNNGTLFTLEEAMMFPVKTIASGPTNSLVGACKLAKCENAVIVDIGGTSTDIGMVVDGFPLYSLQSGVVAGISCNLLTPDIATLAMGGGSIIRRDNQHYTIGPDSLGADLFKKCQTRGGDNLTLYDVGQILKFQPNQDAENIMSYFLEQINQELVSLLPDLNSQLVLLVGGGAENIPSHLLSTNVIRPPHYQIANAYGAALSEIAGHVDCIVQFGRDKESELAALEEKAKAMAIQNGAESESIRIIEKKVLPLYYMHEPMYRVLITAVGPLQTL